MVLSSFYRLNIVIFLIYIVTAVAIKELDVYRMQQFDLFGQPYGCRASLGIGVARLGHLTTVIRKWVVIPVEKLDTELVKSYVKFNIIGLLIVLPDKNASLSIEQEQHIRFLERSMLWDQDAFPHGLPFPVYFTYESSLLREVIDSLALYEKEDTKSASAVLLSSIFNEEQHFNPVPSNPHVSAPDFALTSLESVLSADFGRSKVGSLLITAYYDTTAVSPELSEGADANGSGVAALLELSRIFSRLFAGSRSLARFHLAFLLSAGGTLNFQGAKHWLDDSRETRDAPSYVICLDSLVGKNSSLSLHSSRLYKADSVPTTFSKHLQDIAVNDGIPLQIMQKKISREREFLSWEHEAFSARGFSASTLSGYNMSNDFSRSHHVQWSILDTMHSLDMSDLERKVKLIAKSLFRTVFPAELDPALLKSAQSTFDKLLVSTPKMLHSYMSLLTSEPRSPQLLSFPSPLLVSLKNILTQHSKKVHLLTKSTEKRDPNYILYKSSPATLSIYRVKPAMFDLFLALIIAPYLGLIYILVVHFDRFSKFFFLTSGRSRRTAGKTD